MKPILVKITCDERSIKRQLSDQCSRKDLFDCIDEEFKLERHAYDVSFGFPPKVLLFCANAGLSDTLQSLGISSGTAITVRKNTLKKESYDRMKSAGIPQNVFEKAFELVGCEDFELAREVCEGLMQEQSSYLGTDAFPDDANGLEIERKVISADNSCLFNAVAFLLNPKEPIEPLYYRRIIADTVLSDHASYTADVLGKSNEEYADWILNPDKWGGEIELLILAANLNIEIAAVDIETNKVYLYGEGKDCSERIYLLYDGVHYDALTAGAFKTSFPPANSHVYEQMKAFASDMKDRKQYTNMSGCSLQCKICMAGLKGQKEAVEHAKLTGHQNFGQIILL